MMPQLSCKLTAIINPFLLGSIQSASMLSQFYSAPAATAAARTCHNAATTEGLLSRRPNTVAPVCWQHLQCGASWAPCCCAGRPFSRCAVPSALAHHCGFSASDVRHHCFCCSTQSGFSQGLKLRHPSQPLLLQLLLRGVRRVRGLGLACKQCSSSSAQPGVTAHKTACSACLGRVLLNDTRLRE